MPHRLFLTKFTHITRLRPSGGRAIGASEVVGTRTGGPAMHTGLTKAVAGVSHHSGPKALTPRVFPLRAWPSSSPPRLLAHPTAPQVPHDLGVNMGFPFKGTPHDAAGNPRGQSDYHRACARHNYSGGSASLSPGNGTLGHLLGPVVTLQPGFVFGLPQRIPVGALKRLQCAFGVQGSGAQRLV